MGQTEQGGNLSLGGRKEPTQYLVGGDRHIWICNLDGKMTHFRIFHSIFFNYTNTCSVLFIICIRVKLSFIFLCIRRHNIMKEG